MSKRKHNNVAAFFSEEAACKDDSSDDDSSSSEIDMDFGDSNDSDSSSSSDSEKDGAAITHASKQATSSSPLVKNIVSVQTKPRAGRPKTKPDGNDKYHFILCPCFVYYFHSLLLVPWLCSTSREASWGSNLPTWLLVANNHKDGR